MCEMKIANFFRIESISNIFITNSPIICLPFQLSVDLGRFIFFDKKTSKGNNTQATGYKATSRVNC